MTQYQVDFIRHAESRFNAFGDRSFDVKLSDYGKMQATQIHGNYDLAIVSTLARARDTFILSQLRVKEILFTDLCRELRRGNTIDCFADESVAEETESQICERVEAFTDLLKFHVMRGKRVCVISHYGFIKKLTQRRLRNAQKVTVCFTLSDLK